MFHHFSIFLPFLQPFFSLFDLSFFLPSLRGLIKPVVATLLDVLARNFLDANDRTQLGIEMEAF